MTSDSDSNSPITHIHNVFNESVIHNIENIHLSQFDDPADLELLSSDTTDNGNKKTNHNSHDIKECLLLGQDENHFHTDGPLLVIQNEKLLNHTSSDNLETNTSTNDGYNTTLKEDPSTKREFHYGRNKYSLPSKFKKFQSPLLKKPSKDDNPENTNEHDKNDIDQLILMLLQKKQNPANHVLHPNTILQKKDEEYTSLKQPYDNNNKNKLEEEKEKNPNPDRNFVKNETDIDLNQKPNNNKRTNKDQNENNKTDEDIIVIDGTNINNMTKEENSNEENLYNKTLQTTPNTRYQPPLTNNTKSIDLDTPHKHAGFLHTTSIITPNSKPSIFNPYLKKIQKTTTQTNPIQQNIHASIDIDTRHEQNYNNNFLQNSEKKNTIIINDTKNNNNIKTKIQTSDDTGTHIPNLSPELKSLSKAILSQHNALSQHIIELGNICLNFTNILDKKKNSSNKLIEEGIIPRSLRIKCELTTSPGYENNPNFIILKRDLQTAVSQFMSKGLEIMKEWSLINISLIIRDKCNNIMQKAISILGGIYRYWENIIGPANWTHDIEKNILLVILKIYFETDYIPNISDIIEYFELPPNEILLICSKIITKNTDDIYNQSVLTTIDMIHLNLAAHNAEQLHILTETISAFDNILRATTVELWEANLQNQRLNEAAQILKAKLDTDKIESATAATTRAIEKATEITNAATQNYHTTNLRIANIERQLSHQKQTANEILNHIKRQKTNKDNKHHHKTMPPSPNPFNTHNLNKNISTPWNPFNTSNETSNNKKTTLQINTHTKQHIKQNQQPQNRKRKNIQWDQAHTEITEYNPWSTPIQTFSRSNLLPLPPNPNPFHITQTNPFTRDHPFHPKPTPTTHDYPLQYVDRNNPFTELKSKRSTQHLNRRGEKYKEGKRGPT